MFQFGNSLVSLASWAKVKFWLPAVQEFVEVTVYWDMNLDLANGQLSLTHISW